MQVLEHLWLWGVVWLAQDFIIGALRCNTTTTYPTAISSSPARHLHFVVLQRDFLLHEQQVPDADFSMTAMFPPEQSDSDVSILNSSTLLPIEIEGWATFTWPKYATSQLDQYFLATLTSKNNSTQELKRIRRSQVLHMLLTSKINLNSTESSYPIIFFFVLIKLRRSRKSTTWQPTIQSANLMQLPVGLLY